MIAAVQLPRTIFGLGSVVRLSEELASLGVRRPMLITDRGLRRVGMVDRVLEVLGEPAAMLDDIAENPLFADVDRGARLFAEHECDGVIALGGGSVIDAAKFIALLGANGGAVGDYAGRPHAPHGRAAPLVVAPTTAGTGSEASPDAGIHPDAATASIGMSSPHLVPRVALLDPELTVSLPPRLTAATGIDAISHCIEGYMSSVTSPMVDAIALDGLARAVRSIRAATRNGRDLAARADMMVGAYAGGVAIGMGLGPAHAIAITCGDQGLHHGLLSGIGLVCVMDTVCSHAPDRAAAVLETLGVPPGVQPSCFIAALMRDLSLPATLGELGYRSSHPLALAAAAHASPFNLSSRLHPSVGDYAEMIGRSLDDIVG